MNTKLILSTLAGTVVAYLLGWLIYGVLLASFMTNNTVHYDGLMKAMDGSFMFLILLSNLVMVFLVAFIFQRWAKFEKLLQGLTAGMLLGFLFALSYDLYFIASMNLINVSSMIVDIIANTVVVGITGAVVAWVLGYKSKTATA
jgi:hypothetical protein